MGFAATTSRALNPSASVFLPSVVEQDRCGGVDVLLDYLCAPPSEPSFPFDVVPKRRNLRDTLTADSLNTPMTLMQTINMNSLNTTSKESGLVSLVPSVVSASTQTVVSQPSDWVCFDMFEAALNLNVLSAEAVSLLYQTVGEAFALEASRLKSAEQELQEVLDMMIQGSQESYEPAVLIDLPNHISLRSFLCDRADELPLMARGMKEIVDLHISMRAIWSRVESSAQRFRDLHGHEARLLTDATSHRSNDVAASPGMDRGLMVFEAGDLVEIVNLENQPHLNGQLGFVLQWDLQRGRYQISLLETEKAEEVKLLKPANIRLANG